MNRPSRLAKAVCVGLGLLLLVNSSLAGLAQASFWESRRTSAASQHRTHPNLTSRDALQVAGLPASFLPGHQSSLETSSKGPATLNVPSRAILKRVQSRVSDHDFERINRLAAALPSPYGQIRRISTPASGKTGPLILHIQDVHQNLEAQTHISRIVQSTIDAGEVELIGLEGAFDPIDLNTFKDTPRPSTIHRVADYMLREKRISGPVHGALLSQARLPPLVGVDDHALYQANVDSYRASLAGHKKIKTWLLQTRRELTKKRASVFNPELKKFDEDVDAYMSGAAEFGNFVESLAVRSPMMPLSIQAFLEAFRLEASLDTERIERERAELLSQLLKRLSPRQHETLLAESVAFRLGRHSHADYYSRLKALCEDSGLSLTQVPAMDDYIRYVLLSDSLDLETILRDTAALTNESYEALIQSSSEDALVRDLSYLRLTDKLIDFSLTPEEWEAYQSLSGFSNQVANRPDLRPFEDFYRFAQKRDRAMAARLAGEIGRHNAKIALLVTGGFHSRGILSALEESGVTVITLAPKITQIETAGGMAALSVFTREKTPLEKLFEGERLFLAASPIPPFERSVGLPTLTTLYDEAQQRPEPKDPADTNQFRSLGGDSRFDLTTQNTGPGRAEARLTSPDNPTQIFEMELNLSVNWEDPPIHQVHVKNQPPDPGNNRSLTRRWFLQTGLKVAGMAALLPALLIIKSKAGQRTLEKGVGGASHSSGEKRLFGWFLNFTHSGLSPMSLGSDGSVGAAPDSQYSNPSPSAPLTPEQIIRKHFFARTKHFNVAPYTILKTVAEHDAQALSSNNFLSAYDDFYTAVSRGGTGQEIVTLGANLLGAVNEFENQAYLIIDKFHLIYDRDDINVAFVKIKAMAQFWIHLVTAPNEPHSVHDVILPPGEENVVKRAVSIVDDVIWAFKSGHPVTLDVTLDPVAVHTFVFPKELILLTFISLALAHLDQPLQDKKLKFSVSHNEKNELMISVESNSGPANQQDLLDVVQHFIQGNNGKLIRETKDGFYRTIVVFPTPGATLVASHVNNKDSPPLGSSINVIKSLTEFTNNPYQTLLAYLGVAAVIVGTAGVAWANNEKGGFYLEKMTGPPVGYYLWMGALLLAGVFYLAANVWKHQKLKQNAANLGIQFSDVRAWDSAPSGRLMVFYKKSGEIQALLWTDMERRRAQITTLAFYGPEGIKDIHPLIMHEAGEVVQVLFTDGKGRFSTLEEFHIETNPGRIKRSTPKWAQGGVRLSPHDFYKQTTLTEEWTTPDWRVLEVADSSKPSGSITQQSGSISLSTLAGLAALSFAAGLAGSIFLESIRFDDLFLFVTTGMGLIEAASLTLSSWWMAVVVLVMTSLFMIVSPNGGEGKEGKVSNPDQNTGQYVPRQPFMPQAAPPIDRNSQLPSYKSVARLLEKARVVPRFFSFGKPGFVFLLYHDRRLVLDYLSILRSEEGFSHEEELIFKAGAKSFAIPEMTQLFEAAVVLSLKKISVFQDFHMDTLQPGEIILAFNPDGDITEPLFEAAMEVIKGDDRRPWRENGMSLHVTNAFVWLLFTPHSKPPSHHKTRVHGQPIADWTKAEKAAIRNHYLQGGQLNPNRHLKKIFKQLLEDLKHRVKIPLQVGENSTTLVAVEDLLLKIWPKQEIAIDWGGYTRGFVTSGRNKDVLELIHYIQSMKRFQRYTNLNKQGPLFEGWNSSAKGGNGSLSSAFVSLPLLIALALGVPVLLAGTAGASLFSFLPAEFWPLAGMAVPAALLVFYFLFMTVDPSSGAGRQNPSSADRGGEISTGLKAEETATAEAMAETINNLVHVAVGPHDGRAEALNAILTETPFKLGVGNRFAHGMMGQTMTEQTLDAAFNISHALAENSPIKGNMNSREAEEVAAILIGERGKRDEPRPTTAPTLQGHLVVPAQGGSEKSIQEELALLERLIKRMSKDQVVFLLVPPNYQERYLLAISANSGIRSKIRVRNVKAPLVQSGRLLSSDMETLLETAADLRNQTLVLLKGVELDEYSSGRPFLSNMKILLWSDLVEAFVSLPASSLKILHKLKTHIMTLVNA